VEEGEVVENEVLASLDDAGDEGPEPEAVPLENILGESFAGDTLSALASLGGALPRPFKFFGRACVSYTRPTLPHLRSRGFRFCGCRGQRDCGPSVCFTQ
jgi:hypothetical protein